MALTRRQFGSLPVAAAAASAPRAQGLDAAAIARKHNLVATLPTPNYFEGMLLGNGDIGLCVTLRPDALGLHFGKLDSWDIRVSEEHAKDVLSFADVLKMWDRASARAKAAGRPDDIYLETKDEELKAYTDKVTSSYQKPYPRPWPCGIVWLKWDARKVRLVRQELDLSSGLLTVELLHDDLRGSTKPATLRCFVSRDACHACVWGEGAAVIESVNYAPHRDPKAGLPAPEVSAAATGFSGYQHFPAGVGDPSKDRSFAIEGAFNKTAQRLDVCLFTTRDHPRNREHAANEVKRFAAVPAGKLRADSEAAWRKFWSASAVSFADADLERIWYRNQYLLACTLKPGVVAPGLFGNWTSGNIGTAWHGDYHMNYNTQQVWWGVFSSNHAEQHFPYVELVEMLRPQAQRNAREQFGLPGAYYPHSAYPVPSQVNAYPAPPWGYEICETPWTVQSLWWHYLYTLDLDLLRRVYPLMKEAGDFLLAYVKKGADGRYHIEPSVSPENWGMTVDGRLNRDCIIDIALSEFLLDALERASAILQVDPDLRAKWRDVRSNFAPYPEVNGPYGRVWLDILNAPAEWIYNVPVTISPVFPAERVGLGVREDLLELARRTLRTIRLEGGNDLVWLPFVHARLGTLDFPWFKREVAYCTLPNGVSNDRVRQAGGRYADSTDFDFMMRMGVWTENLSLPAVLNECLMQSYSGVIRLFPNAKGLSHAAFQDLRTVGAFLVSAEWDGARAVNVRMKSEKGAKARVWDVWNGKARVREQNSDKPVASAVREGVLEFDTEPGSTYLIGG